MTKKRQLLAARSTRYSAAHSCKVLHGTLRLCAYCSREQLCCSMEAAKVNIHVVMPLYRCQILTNLVKFAILENFVKIFQRIKQYISINISIDFDLSRNWDRNVRRFWAIDTQTFR